MIIAKHANSNVKTGDKEECFVIMPISEPDGYDDQHFTKVYQDIFKPACESAGYDPIRSDEVKQTNLIHLDILQKLIDSPMAICDLSSRNPNVLFELGLRQAFDKPTVLVQEVGTPKIFDIAPLRYTEYRKELRYREALEDQSLISEALEATKAATAKGQGVNSIVRILSLANPASLKEINEGDSSGLLQLVRAEMSEMRSDFRRVMGSFERTNRRFGASESKNYSIMLNDAFQAIGRADKLLNNGAPSTVVKEELITAKKVLSTLAVYDLPQNIYSEFKDMISLCDDIERKMLSLDRDR